MDRRSRHYKLLTNPSFSNNCLFFSNNCLLFLYFLHNLVQFQKQLLEVVLVTFFIYIAIFIAIFIFIFISIFLTFIWIAISCRIHLHVYDLAYRMSCLKMGMLLLYVKACDSRNNALLYNFKNFTSLWTITLFARIFLIGNF